MTRPLKIHAAHLLLAVVEWSFALWALPGCFEAGVDSGSGTTGSCTVTFRNQTSATAVRQILVYYPSRPLAGSEYLDVDVAPGESYSFQAYADRGLIYLCPKQGAGHGCLADLYIDSPRAGASQTITLTDSNCNSCN